MNETIPNKGHWKEKVYHEMIEYWINFLYLAIFFAVFTWYRRLILAEYHITYLHYWIAIIEALVLAKVILIGDAFRLGRRLEEKSLVLPTLYKSAVFTVFVGAFAVLEHTVGGLVHGKGVAGGVQEMISTGMDELLARCLVTFFAFIPFFAFRELARVLGEGKIRLLFFRRKAAS